MCEISFKSGKVHEAIEIMKEAARWLINNGNPLWKIDDLEPEKLLKTAEEKDFIVSYFLFCIN